MFDLTMGRVVLPMKYNPEKRAWRGKSYKNGGQWVKDLREGAAVRCVR